MPLCPPFPSLGRRTSIHPVTDSPSNNLSPSLTSQTSMLSSTTPPSSGTIAPTVNSQTSPLSSKQKISTTDADNVSNQGDVSRHHAFSPLTLDELGLNPLPAQDISFDIGSNMSFANPEDILDSTSQTDRRNQAIDESFQIVTPQSHIKGQDQSALQESTSNQVSAISVPVSSPVAYHNPLLDTFLHSLTEKQNSKSFDQGEDKQTAFTAALDRAGVSTDFFEEETADASWLSSLGALAAKDAASQPPKAMQTPSLAALGRSDPSGLIGATTSNPRPCWGTSQAPSSSVTHSLPSSVPAPTNKTSTGHLTASSKSNSSRVAHTWSSFLPFRSDDLLVTSKPLDQPHSSTFAASGPNASIPVHNRTHGSHSAQSQHPNGRKKATCSLDLSDLSNFSLPQAPPLQPEHRYPGQILETDGRYEPDPETDRDADIASRPGASPPCKDVFSLLSGPPKQVVAGSERTLSLDSTHSQGRTAASDKKRAPSFDCGLDKRAANESHASSSVQEIQHNSIGQLKGERSALKMVPLTNVVRNRSWSDASDSNGMPPWEVGVNMGQAGRRPSIGPDYTAASRQERKREPNKVIAGSTTITSKAPGSQPAGATATPFNRSKAHELLLDFVRHNNLAISSDSLSIVPGASASIKTPSNPTSIPALPSSAPGWSSTVPAELQAHLQNWQQHRKRQRTHVEDSDEATSKHKAAHAPETPIGNAGEGTTFRTPLSTAQTNAPPARSGQHSGKGSEQEQKARKQEHYQRVLLQLHTQMRTQMQMQRQKQKELQERIHNNEFLETQKDESLEIRSKQEKQVDPTTACPPTVPLAARSPNKKAQERSAASRPELLPDRTQDHVTCSGSNVEAYKDDEGYTKVPVRSAAENARTKELLSAAASGAWTTASTGIATSSPSRMNPDSARMGPPSNPASLPFPTWQASEAALSLFQTGRWWGQDTNVGLGVTNIAVQPTADPTTRSWLPAPDFDQHIAANLVLKHPNWLRDESVPSLVPISSFPANLSHRGRNSAASTLDTPTLSTSSALSSTPSLYSGSQLGLADTSGPVQETSSNKKRPFSPGEEVVFWAVKGEFSVKLMGTVESVSMASSCYYCMSDWMLTSALQFSILLTHSRRWRTALLRS